MGRGDAPVLVDQEGGRVQRLGPPHWQRHPAAAREEFRESPGQRRDEHPASRLAKRVAGQKPRRADEEGDAEGDEDVGEAGDEAQALVVVSPLRRRLRLLAGEPAEGLDLRRGDDAAGHRTRQESVVDHRRAGGHEERWRIAPI